MADGNSPNMEFIGVNKSLGVPNMEFICVSMIDSVSVNVFLWGPY